MALNIDIQSSGGVCVLRLDRSDRKNAITAAMYAALADGLAQAASEPAVRVAVIRGHETAFTAGNDLGDFLNNPPSGEDAPVFRFLRAIAGFPKPLIAAVCGPAVGVGTTLLLHCDLVYAGENATLRLPFVDLGLCPEAASSLLLPAIAGHQRAAEKLLLGEPFGAAEAKELGIVNRVMPVAEVDDFAIAQARKLAAKPLSSLLATKSLMKDGLAAAVRERMVAEGALFGKMLREPAAREAFTAFMEKRAPDFSKTG
ncbi:MAG: enoyl-CoA hydratase [Burkholderiales bacterium]|nr:MAG: enoyl-CoA hydratase [Burkholderiales bacterium]